MPHAFDLCWLAATALLVSHLGAAEEVALAPSRAANAPRCEKCIASDVKQLAIAAQKLAIPARDEILSPRLSELEQRLFDQIGDGCFGEVSLLEAGLIAGGIEGNDELRRYCQQFESLVESLRRSAKVCGAPREKAKVLFAFLHQAILHGGYDLKASDLRLAFDHGRFNCVTASLLFNCLADRFGLKAVGLEVPGHALSRLLLPEETLDIETTCPQWFMRNGRSEGLNSPQHDRPAPGQHEPLARAAWPSNSPTGTAKSKQPRLRQVSDVELVATIYYNRGVDLLAEKKYAEAVAVNAKAVRLDPENATAKGNFLATINNWAIDLGTSGKYEQAAELLRTGLAADPSYAAFRTNYVQLFRHWSEHLCRDGRFADALRLLTQAAQEQPNEKFFRESVIEMLRRCAEHQGSL
jgi:tetratricopeptide (TPR) repeat protein